MPWLIAINYCYVLCLLPFYNRIMQGKLLDQWSGISFSGMWNSRALSVNPSPANSAEFGAGFFKHLWDLCLIPGRVLGLYSAVMLYTNSAMSLSTRNFHLLFYLLVPDPSFSHTDAHSAHFCRLTWKCIFLDMCWLVWTIFSSGSFLDANLAMVTEKLLELWSCLIFSVFDCSVNISELSLW